MFEMEQRDFGAQLIALSGTANAVGLLRIHATLLVRDVAVGRLQRRQPID
jgi:hypothetical protein